MAIEPNKRLLDDPKVPRVVLDGVEWAVPKLAPRQNRQVVPLVLEIYPKITGAIDRSDPEKPRFNPTVLAGMLNKQGITDLYDVVYVGLTRAQPELTRAEFDDMPIGIQEAVEAMLIVSKQTGIIKAATAQEAAGPLDRAAPASPTST